MNSRIGLEASEIDGGTIPEDTVEEMESEIIRACMKQWRTFKPSNRNKRLIIDLGVKIFDMLVKYKASQSELSDMKSQIEALRTFGVPILETPIRR